MSTTQNTLREQTKTVAVQIPEPHWREFRIALALDGLKMQTWVNRRLDTLLATPWDALAPRPYRRVPRAGPTRQVIARVPAEKIQSLRLRLARLGIPMSRYIYEELLTYVVGLDVRVADALRTDPSGAPAPENGARRHARGEPAAAGPRPGP